MKSLLSWDDVGSRTATIDQLEELIAMSAVPDRTGVRVIRCVINGSWSSVNGRKVLAFHHLTGRRPC